MARQLALCSITRMMIAAIIMAVLCSASVALAQETLPVAVPDAEITVPDELLQNTNGTRTTEIGIQILAETVQPSATTKSPSSAPISLGNMAVAVLAALLFAVLSAISF